jgi:hypothetical protein
LDDNEISELKFCLNETARNGGAGRWGFESTPSCHYPQIPFFLSRNSARLHSVQVIHKLDTATENSIIAPN